MAGYPVIQRVPWTVQPQGVEKVNPYWASRQLKTVAVGAQRRNLVNGAAPSSVSGEVGVGRGGVLVRYLRANNGDRYAAPHLSTGSAGSGSVLLVWQHSAAGIAGSDRAIANVGTDVTTAGFRIATNSTGGDKVFGQAYNTSSSLVSITGPGLVVGQLYATVLTAGPTMTLYQDGAIIGSASVSGGVRRTASAKTVGPGYLADVDALLFAEFDSLLPEAEALALTANPWQLFAPLRRTIWVPVSAGGATSLTVADGTHAHAADNLGLTLDTYLAIQEAAHAHAADNLGLTLDTYLAVADALHDHLADNLALSALSGTTLIIDDGAHAHAGDNLALTLDTWLAIADALHAHGAESLALTLDTFLALADATHGHTADNLTLTLPGAALTDGEFRQLYDWVNELALIHGLISGSDLVVTPTSRDAGAVNQTIATVGTTVTVSR